MSQKKNGLWVKSRLKIDGFLSRRPHRSFRKTKRRDYIKPLKLPGYWSFSISVFRFFKKNRKILLLVVLVYAVLTGVLVGLSSQDVYSSLYDLLESTSGDIFNGNWGQIGEAAILFTTILSGGTTATLSESQQIYAVLIALMTWLSSVWVIRSLLADKKIKLRDALYSSGAPILSTFLVFLVGLVQLLPMAIAIIGYVAAASTGLLNGGVEGMLFWFAAGLLGVISMYWITSTFIALIIVSLPGVYPFKAIQAAGDLVVGRRIRILLRLLWMTLGLLLAWIIIMIPLIIFDLWFKNLIPALSWLPLVPGAILFMSSLTIVWSSTYIYLLYRKIIDNDADS